MDLPDGWKLARVLGYCDLKSEPGVHFYENSLSAFCFLSWCAVMNAPGTVQLVELNVGECFQFAQHRSRRMMDEHVPQWKVVHAGTEFYEVMLDNISPISSGPAARSTRLASTTLVRRVVGVRNPDFEPQETADAKPADK